VVFARAGGPISDTIAGHVRHRFSFKYVAWPQHMPKFVATTGFALVETFDAR
jgi:hypothetical protein